MLGWSIFFWCLKQIQVWDVTPNAMNGKISLFEPYLFWASERRFWSCKEGMGLDRLAMEKRYAKHIKIRCNSIKYDVSVALNDQPMRLFGCICGSVPDITMPSVANEQHIAQWDIEKACFLFEFFFFFYLVDLWKRAIFVTILKFKFDQFWAIAIAPMNKHPFFVCRLFLRDALRMEYEQLWSVDSRSIDRCNLTVCFWNPSEWKHMKAILTYLEGENHSKPHNLSGEWERIVWNKINQMESFLLFWLKHKMHSEESSKTILGNFACPSHAIYWT